ncbi:MAG: efflux RND transporter periplasmic adaptor subunit [Steroidobacteraceae bacterium]|jgi:RND family efflux transporter MFP subunit|nr:efflux RND transporter periplasmic adaptor subunit [Steroidobacteraceae bacterium]
MRALLSRFLHSNTPPRPLAALVATGVLAACGGAEPPAPATEPRTVRVAPVESAPFASQVAAVGLLAPKDAARLSFKVGGVVESVRVEEGDPVRRGQVLASLKQTEIGSAVAQAREAADKARRDLDRARALYADGVTTEEQVQDLTTAHRVAQAALQGTEFNARYARIEAPADGVVLRRTVEPNELVQPGQPVLVVGGTARGWIVRTALADRDVVHAATGDPARVTFDAWPGRTFEGRVAVVSSAADAATGTFPIEVEVQPGDARFVSGLVAKVTLAPRGAQVASAPVVPIRALLEAEGDRANVFVVDPATSIASRVSVRIGRLGGEQVEVVDGLRLGQQVVTDGSAFLDDGEVVRIAGPVVASAARGAAAGVAPGARP